MAANWFLRPLGGHVIGLSIIFLFTHNRGSAPVMCKQLSSVTGAQSKGFIQPPPQKRASGIITLLGSG